MLRPNMSIFDCWLMIIRLIWILFNMAQHLTIQFLFDAIEILHFVGAIGIGGLG